MELRLQIDLKESDDSMFHPIFLQNVQVQIHPKECERTRTKMHSFTTPKQLDIDDWIDQKTDKMDTETTDTIFVQNVVYCVSNLLKGLHFAVTWIPAIEMKRL